MSDKLIFVPYAYDCEKATGVNIRNSDDSRNTYCKNFCVALVSLKRENPECDVALVTNTQIPEQYAEVLYRNEILILQVPYDRFTFPKDYKWSLAFYKLCALAAVVEQYDYGFYSYFDTDVIANGSLNPVWLECEKNILLYDVGHGLNVRDYCDFLQEIDAFLGEKSYITHYGGEFFGATKENARVFVEECQRIYDEMAERNFVTTRGDEFILSLAAERNRQIIKNAGAYVFRFWTGQFYLVSTRYLYNPVAILHLPNEKERGILKIYDRYIERNKYPSKNQIYRLCHLSRQRLEARIKRWVKSLLH